MCDIFSIVHPSILGAIVGAAIAHFAAKSRDAVAAKVAAKNRVLRFRGFIMKCRCIFYRSTDLIKNYTEIAPEIAFECGMVAGDCATNEELIKLCRKADSFKAAEYEDTQDAGSRESILTKHMDSMIVEIDLLLESIG